MVQTSGYIEQTDFQSQLDTHLEEAIDELREKSEMEIEDYKTSVDNAYKDKVSYSGLYIRTAETFLVAEIGYLVLACAWNLNVLCRVYIHLTTCVIECLSP